MGVYAGDVELSSEAGETEEHGEPGGIVDEFDFLEDDSVHHFVDEKVDFFPKEWAKNVNKELKIHKEPNALIYVRGYQGRMDLFTAAIIGSPGTSYHDGLFFFDLHLPAQYPHIPPKVHFHYGAEQINPNLLADGSICLSLLNSTEADPSQCWDPTRSNVLHVLLSIQALVLNKNPYFNEDSYTERIKEADVKKNSENYNEAVFLKNLGIMIHVVIGPPKGFEEVVKTHSMKRGPLILRACEGYLEGRLVGTSLVEDHSGESNSAGFKKSLEHMMMKLKTAFEKLDIVAEPFIPPV